MHKPSQNPPESGLSPTEEPETPAIAGYGKIGQNWDADAEVEVLYADATFRPRFASLKELSPEGALRVTTGKSPSGGKRDRNRIPEWRLDPGRASAAAKALECVIITYEASDPVRNRDTILCKLLKEAKAELDQPFSYFRTRRTSVVVHGGRTLDVESATEQKRRNSTSSLMRLEKSNARNEEESETGSGSLKRRESASDQFSRRFTQPNPPSTIKKRRKSLPQFERGNIGSETEDETSLTALSSEESSSVKVRVRLSKMSASACDETRKKDERGSKNLNRGIIIKATKSASRCYGSLNPRDDFSDNEHMQKQKRNEISLPSAAQNEISIVQQLRTWKRPNVRYGTGKKKSSNDRMTNGDPSLATHSQIPSKGQLASGNNNNTVPRPVNADGHPGGNSHLQTPGPETPPGAYSHHEKQLYLSNAHQRTNVDANPNYSMSTPSASYISPASTPCWTCSQVRNSALSKSTASSATDGPIPHSKGEEPRYLEDEILIRQHEDLKDALMTCIRRTLTGPSKRLRDDNASGSVRGSFGENSSNIGSDVVTLRDQGGDKIPADDDVRSSNDDISRKNKMDIGHILSQPTITRTPPSPKFTGVSCSSSSSSWSEVPAIPSFVSQQPHPPRPDELSSACTEFGMQSEIFRAEEEKLVRMVRRLVLAARHSWDVRLVETEGLAPWIGGIDQKEDHGKGKVRV